MSKPATLSPLPIAKVPTRSRVDNLVVTCLAGTFVGLLPVPDLKLPHSLLRQSLRAVRADFEPGLASSQGDQAQRAYAFLSGTGGTRLSCDPLDVARLAADPAQVPDPELLLQFADSMRGTGVGIDSFCRQPPQPVCPRPLRFGRGEGGI